jgi:glycosyltransferase involved in cell wall biosynthesis
MPTSVAIVIPTYNRAGLVTRAIDSALCQQGVALQVVVVDDGSTDATPRTLERYLGDDRVRVIRHPANRGVTAAKNTGLDNVLPETELVGILDSDDVLLDGALAALAAAFEARSGGCSQVFGWCRDSRTGAPTGRMVLREGPVTFEDGLSGRFSGEFWQLARCDMLGGLRFEERARGGEASVWWRLLRERPGWLVPEVVREYDRSGRDRVSLVDYSPAGAAGSMWAYRAGMRAFGADMRRHYPPRYAELAAELAKWAALAGDGCIARAAARSGLRAAPTGRGAVALAMSLVPSRMLRAVAEGRAKIKLQAGRG